MLDALKEKYPSLEIIKKYPNTGQKQVYLASVDGYGTVILKIVKNMDDRVRRELDIVKDINIPGVPKVNELSSIQINDEEIFYYFEEYIEGNNLEEVFKQGNLGVKQSMDLLEYLLTVVVELEKNEIVHRDIKPANIILDKEGTFHLIDFGIARDLKLTSLTFSGVQIGPHTPGYGAPELFQYNKKAIDSRADLFSIGVVIYQAVFGKHPFISGKESDVSEIWYLTATVTPKQYTIPGDNDAQLMGLIKTLLQKQITKRPPTARKALEWYQVVKDTVLLEK